MTIWLKCVTNTNDPYINTAHFLTDKGEIIIDRDRTDYFYDDNTGVLSMGWVRPYIWDGKEPNYNIPATLFDNAVLKELEVEDDAPTDYEIRCIGCCVDEKEIPVAIKEF